MRENIINLVGADIQAIGIPQGSIEEKLAAYIRATYQHWLGPTDTERLQAAVMVTVLNTTNQADKVRLLKSWALVAAGVPVDFDKMTKEEEDFKAIPIMEIWHENK